MTKRLLALVLIAAVFLGLGGCVYDPAYYHRSAVVYDDGEGVYSEPYYDTYYAPGPYYYSPGYYGYGWGFPYIGFSYYGGGHHHHHSYHHGGTYHHHH